MNIKAKVAKIKKYINDNDHIDGDFWHYSGNEFIYKILDTFDESDWQYLIKDLTNFEDKERYQFSNTLLGYDTDRIISIVDIYEIFFTQYLLLKLEDADWIIQDIMYVENIRNPNIYLLEKLRQKINQIRGDEKTAWNEEQFLWAESIIDKVLKKHYR
jgi:hypothetical protein